MDTIGKIFFDNLRSDIFTYPYKMIVSRLFLNEYNKLNFKSCKLYVISQKSICISAVNAL